MNKNIKLKGAAIRGMASNTTRQYKFNSVGCTLECEKILDNKEELAKLSGEVITYKVGE